MVYLLIAGGLIVFCLAVWGIYVVADSWFLSEMHGLGTIISKKYTPAHTQIIMIHNPATQTHTPQPITCPEIWSVKVDVGGDETIVTVGKDFFEATFEGDKVPLIYVACRFSLKIHVTEISELDSKSRQIS